MRIGVPKETAPGERRVALVPESAKKLIQAGYEVAVEAGAGTSAGYPDAAYREAGATVAADRSRAPGRRRPGAEGRTAGGWRRRGTRWAPCGRAPSISAR